MAHPTRLIVAQAKITEYLLNPDHPSGASKAKFFLARGFDRDRPLELARQLVSLALLDWPGIVVPSDGAVKHRITGAINCPNGTSPTILTVWQIDEGSAEPFFVTAIPQKPKLVK